jgi:hypothetical protein
MSLPFAAGKRAVRVLPAAPQPRFGSYEVVGALGQGGMAEVWQAVQRLSGGSPRAVALKRMRAHLMHDASALRMFREEARLSARLQHPNIVRVLEHGELHGQPFIAFELVDGVELRRLLRERTTPLPFGFTVFMLRQLCSALAYAHRLADENGKWLRIVHRDVSPSNVMIGSDGNAKLLDFGVARMRRDDGSETTFGVAKGKIGYMAPEVAAGQPVDERGDLFSLGVVLYEMLAHRRLFSDKDERMALLLNRSARATAPSQANREVPASLDEVTLRALKRDPAERYQRAAEMEAALARLQEAMPWTAEDAAALIAEHRPPAVELPPEPYTDGVDELAPTAPLAMGEAATVAAKRPAAPVPAPPRRFLRASRIVLFGGVLSAAVIVGVIRRERAVGGKSEVVVVPADEPSSAPPAVAAPSAPAGDEQSAPGAVASSAAPVAAPSVVPKASTSSRPAAARSPSRAHTHSSTSRTHGAAPPLRNDRLFNPFGSPSRNQ